MTTRSGKRYKEDSSEMTAEGGTGSTELVRLLVEDRQ